MNVAQFEVLEEDARINFERLSHVQKIILMSAVIVFMAGMIALLWWTYPMFLEDVVIPSLDWAERTFNKAELAVIIVVTLSVIPVCVFFAGFPAIWLAGIVFGYGWGLMLVTVGTTLGMTLPFIIGRNSRWFQSQVQKQADKRPKVAAVLSGVGLAGEFKAVLILRLGPIPYTWLNYVLSAAPTVQYWRHYIPPSVLARIPQNLADLQFGILIRDLADYYQGKSPETTRVIEMVVGLTASLATVVGGYYYSKRAWRKIQAEIEAQELICSVETDEADYVPNTSSSVALNHLERSSSQDSGIALAPMSNSLVQSNNLEMLNVTIQPRNTTLPPLGDLAMVHILGDDSSS